jgi:RimJ/RimL family protein N-acetyltransferase
MPGIPADFRPPCPRLTLRRFTVADAPLVCAIQANWNVTRMLRMAPFPPDPDDIAAWLAGHDAEWAAGIAFRFAVEAEGRLVGCADVDEIAGGAGEIGYWFEETTWGRGYASEAAAAVVAFAIGKLGLRRLESGHAADNPASGRVLARLGFHPVGDTMRWYRSRQREVLHRAYRREAGA